MIQVASYCRVSTDKEDQANSFESQQRYFKEYIDRQPDWELYSLYADEGITGTSTKKRVQFNRMISDAESGRFKLIITKEVSRFSRNILDTILYTRKLKALGVGVIFMNDGISTLEPDAELRLSIMGSIAQEESRKTSSRVKWGQTRQMERGVVFGTSMLGYDVKDGKMTINPEGAEIIRLIFHKYGIEKKGTSVIARELRESGYKTYTGNTSWSNSHIVKILKNEKYVGDLVQKKTFTPDYLSHNKKYNHGEEEMVTIQNHHEPIIDRDLWNTVQSELAKRNPNGEMGVGHSNRYLFSGKIRCGECGASFVSRKKYRKDGSFYRKWSCFTAVNEGRRHTDPMGNNVGCDIGMMLRDDTALEIVRQGIGSLKLDTEWIIRNVSELAAEAILAGESQGEDSEERLQYSIERTMKKKENVLDAFFSGTITKDEMRMVNEKYDKELTDLQARLKILRKRQELHYDSNSLTDDIKKEVASIIQGDTKSEVFYKNLLDHLTVYPGNRVELRLNLLPQKWMFVINRLHGLKLTDIEYDNTPVSEAHRDPSVPSSMKKCTALTHDKPAHRDPSVPTSVSIPLTSP